MENVTRFAAVNAKIRSLQGKFLKDKDYINMLEKNSVKDVANYLKDNTYYGEMLQDINLENISRRDLENILKNYLIKNVEKIRHYFNGNYKKFIKSLYVKYEIEDLKSFARLIFNGTELDSYEKTFVFVGKYSDVEPEKVFASKTIGDLIRAFEGSEFYKYIEHILKGKRESLFYLEMALDMAYYSIIQRYWKMISKSDRQILEKMEGIIADLFNIQWIYRGMKFYSLSPEEILNYTIDFGDKLTYNERKALCYAKSLDEFFALTKESTPYSFLFNKEIIDLYMERRINRYIYFKLRALERTAMMNIIHVVAYILFLEFEIRDIISITESIRYNMPYDEAKKFLIREI